MSSMSHTLRSALMANATMFFTVGLSVPVAAQVALPSEGQPPVGTTPTAQPPQGDSVEPQTDAVADTTVKDIVVTGTRVKRDGYSAPTPETVLSGADIAAAAPANIANYVNTLPALSASNTPRTQTQNVSSGTAGSNFLNLRGLGPTRTLVLLDGRRVVGASVDGLVDVNTLPSALVSRIDVVTGGASAAYGSDAVSGVVNFVLDTKFTGLRVSAQAGVTEYGDGGNQRLELASGASFANGRGHILVSGMYSKDAGVTESASRPWFNGAKIIANPAFAAGNGQPSQIAVTNANQGSATLGGIVTSGTLRGTEFLTGGATRPFQYGQTTGIYSLGGQFNDQAGYYALSTPVEQYTAFGRISFDFSEAFKVFAEGNYARTDAKPGSPYNFYYGNLTVQRDNAFLNDTLRQRLVNAGQTSFGFGTLNGDLGRIDSDNKRELQRYVLGAGGDLGGGWSYDVYGQYGRTAIDVSARTIINANYARAIDSVRNAAGQIVCRSTLSNPNNGCVPYNVFGTEVNSAAAMNYVTGVATSNSVLEQRVASATIQGEPFSTWAGPVSLVGGGEYRKEEISSQTDAISRANGFYSGNYKPTNGNYDVYEFFAETVVPLARKLPALYNLDLNGAVRRTHYSTSGSVTTWKGGISYSPIRDLRFRFTRSRDIRAPNLSDLFLGGTISTARTARDPFTNTTATFSLTTQGNPALAPERADTLSFGGVLQPSFIPGLSLSVDYFDIKIRDALVVPTGQQIFDRCFTGNQTFCSLITRNPAGAATAVTTVPLNLSVERERGLDIEGSYRQDLSQIVTGWDANLTLRVLGTHIFTRYTDDGLTRDYADGENSGALPKRKVNSSLTYEGGPFRGQFSARSVSSGVYDRAFTSAILADNHIPGATYFDLGVSWKMPFAKDSGEGEFFVNVSNLFNKDPVYVLPTAQQFLVAPVNAALYDTLGREFRAGFRAKF